MAADDFALDADTQALQQFESPVFSQLTKEQLAGTTCVWCSVPLDDGLGIDLGYIGDRIRPHACQPCRTARVAFLRSFFDWLEHCSSCVACEDGRRCPDSDALQCVHVAARRRAGKSELRCRECGHVVSWAHRCTPIAWHGESGVYLQYSHADSCTQPALLAALM
jgi:hypothetical protein